MYLLIFQISLFAGLIKRHFGFELMSFELIKFDWWSFKETNAFDFARQSTFSEAP